MASALKQSIRITKASDGVALAWAEAGTGPDLIKAPNWLTHLEYDCDSPVWRHWHHFFAEHYRYVRYDERGGGMSEWDVDEIALRRSVDDFETVIEVARPKKPFIIFGISQGGATAIHYAVQHPEHVSHLVLYGAYAQGELVRGDSEAVERYHAVAALMRLGWGKNNPVYRQLFTSRFIPGASDEQLRWFNELCRKTATPENAARIKDSRARVDIVDLLPRVAVPTLVLHSRDEEAVPLSQGRLLASNIPGAKFVELDFRNHILLDAEPAWARFKEEVLAFTGRSREHEQDSSVFDALSTREREILRRVAGGLTNLQIGRELFISEKTVRNHLTRIFDKLGVNSRAQAIVLAKDKQLR